MLGVDLTAYAARLGDGVRTAPVEAQQTPGAGMSCAGSRTHDRPVNAARESGEGGRQRRVLKQWRGDDVPLGIEFTGPARDWGCDPVSQAVGRAHVTGWATRYKCRK